MIIVIIIASIIIITSIIITIITVTAIIIITSIVIITIITSIVTAIHCQVPRGLGRPGVVPEPGRRAVRHDLDGRSSNDSNSNNSNNSSSNNDNSNNSSNDNNCSNHRLPRREIWSGCGTEFSELRFLCVVLRSGMHHLA